MALDPNRPGRIRCEAIGCRRTAPADKYPEGTRIVCGKCWRAYSTAEERREHSRQDKIAERTNAKLTALYDAGQPLPLELAEEYDAAARAARVIFERILKRSVEHRTGLA